MNITVLHGPNLNLLGVREPEIYGTDTLPAINASIEKFADEFGHTVTMEQHNGEGGLVDAIQRARLTSEGIVINPAGYSHTSVAIRDALLATGVPTVEVHLSVPEAREEFRQISLISDIVIGRISGFGGDGYLLALQGLIRHIEEMQADDSSGS